MNSRNLLQRKMRILLAWNLIWRRIYALTLVEMAYMVRNGSLRASFLIGLINSPVISVKHYPHAHKYNGRARAEPILYSYIPISKLHTCMKDTCIRINNSLRYMEEMLIRSEYSLIQSKNTYIRINLLTPSSFL